MDNATYGLTLSDMLDEDELAEIRRQNAHAMRERLNIPHPYEGQRTSFTETGVIVRKPDGTVEEATVTISVGDVYIQQWAVDDFDYFTVVRIECIDNPFEETVELVPHYGIYERPTIRRGFTELAYELAASKYDPFLIRSARM